MKTQSELFKLFKKKFAEKTRGETYVKTNDFILHGNEILDLKNLNIRIDA